MIASFDIEDADGYEQYAQAANPILERYNGELVVLSDEAKVLEGEARQINAVVRFESEERAMSFYNDPDYQPLKQLRLRATGNGVLMLAQHFSVPSI
jgi:uncharacterized protein (DUF1330 family)